jgi:hypothetical protein
LVPDYNHDRVIDEEDRARAAQGDIFYFWINDDDDEGETGGDDIPLPTMSSQESRRDCDNFRIDGVRDLIDFFPVALDIKTLLGIFQPNVYEYRLKAATENLKVVFPELTTETVENYLVDVETARTVALKQTFPVPQDKWPISGAYNIAARQGLSTMLTTASTQDAPSVVLLEGVKSGQASLVLEVFDPSGNKVFSNSLNLSLDGVEQMFRHVNLINVATNEDTPPQHLSKWGEPGRSGEPSNCPDNKCLNTDGKEFVFVHGYNVDGQQARGWQNEMFKRLFWSGLKSRFWGVTWYGSETQLGSLTFNFHINVRHALHSASALRAFLNENMKGPTSIAAHSLGNLLVSSALIDPEKDSLTAPISNVFMIDAAVPLEAFTGELEGGGDPNYSGGDALYTGGDDPAVYTAANPMAHSDWYGYAKKLGASEWYKHFIEDVAVGGDKDQRQFLTFKNRFANLIGANFYNFFSSGEEVLDTHIGNPGLFDIATNGPGRYAWALQEKLKGRMVNGMVLGSPYGGWEFVDDYTITTSSGTITYLNKSIPKDKANQLMPYDLKIRPFFNLGWASPLPEPGGSDWAEVNRDQLLAEAIPSMTLPAGGPGGSKMIKSLLTDNVIDMQSTFTNDWPEERTSSEMDGWRHSDLKNVAYLYIYNIFNKMLKPMESTQ